MKILKKYGTIAILAIFLSHIVRGDEVDTKLYTHPFLVYYGAGSAFTLQDFDTLAKFDILVLDRFRYKKKQNTWNALRHRNPELKILLYQLGPEVNKSHDEHQAFYLNNIGRYGVSRQHPMGNIAHDNPEFFLLDKRGRRIARPRYDDNYLLDFSNPRFIEYWLRSVSDDIVNRPWVADGIMMDNGLTDYVRPINKLRYPQPVRFLKEGSWDKAMNRFIDVASQQLANQKQLLMVNRGNSRHEKPLAAWGALDKMPHPPAYVLEEGAFAVSWGRASVQFLPVEDWLRQIELPESIKNSSVALISHSKIGPGETGLDSSGSFVSFKQIFLYAFGSYQLAKRSDGPRTFFAFDHSRNDRSFRHISWFDIYRSGDFGRPTGRVKKLDMLNGSVFFREFKNGYVYVNAGNKSYNKLVAPTDSSMLTMDLRGPIGKKQVPYFNINGHTAIYFEKLGLSNE